MELISVISSNIARIGYDLQNHILVIEFKDGAMYEYYGVSVYTYHALLSAASKGTYFAQHIRDQYTYTKVRGRKKYEKK